MRRTLLVVVWVAAAVLVGFGLVRDLPTQAACHDRGKVFIIAADGERLCVSDLRQQVIITPLRR